MKILMIPSWYPNKNNPLSGIFFKEQVESLNEYGIDVGCIAISESSFKFISNDKMSIVDYKNHRVNKVNTIEILYPVIDRVPIIRKFLRKVIFKVLFKVYIKKYGVPDLIHLHSFYFGDLALWIKNKYNIPYIVTEHSTAFARDLLTRNQLEYAQKVFYNSSYNIAVSNEFKFSLEKKFNNINFDYIPNFIDTDFFSFSPQKSYKEFRFVNIAFLDKKKNQKMLIKSFYRVFKNDLNVKLQIVGDGSEYHNLKALVEKLSLENQITLYGRATRDEIRKLLHSSDAFLLSSEYETFGIVVIEAMSCGLPVLSTKCGGPESIIINKKLGLLCEKNEASFSESLWYMYNNKYEQSYIREYVVENFSKNSVSKKLINIYQNEIKRK